jgi:hypothetical protein
MLLLLVIGIPSERSDDIESEMNEGMAIQEAHRKRTKLHRRPINQPGAARLGGAPIKRFHQLALVRQRNDLEILRLPGVGSQHPAINIGLDGERFCVRLFETEFEEVA